jgi:hypothetical protein
VLSITNKLKIDAEPEFILVYVAGIGIECIGAGGNDYNAASQS